MPETPISQYERSREVTDRCKDFIREQMLAYLLSEQDGAAKEMVVALAEVAAEIGFNSLGKPFAQSLFDWLAGTIRELDDSQTLRNRVQDVGSIFSN